MKMNYYLLLGSLLIAGTNFTSPLKKTKRTKKPQPGLALEKTICKRLIQRVTTQGILLSLVDSQTALIGKQTPDVFEVQSAVNWNRLAQSITEPGRIAYSLDPEIEFNLQ